MKLTLPKWELIVLRDSQKLRAWLQGSKHLALRCFLYCWKVFKVYMSKMASHEPFGHLQHKLWSKEMRESNCQFDSRPLKVGNRPDSSACRWSAAHRWKALQKSYNFARDLIPIGGLNWELWAPKVVRVQTGIISGLLLGSPRTNSHSDVTFVGECRKYYMGEGGGFPRAQAVVSPVSPCCPWLVPTLKVIQNEE